MSKTLMLPRLQQIYAWTWHAMSLHFMRLHAAALFGAATVVRNRRHIADGADFQTGSLNRANRGFAPATGAFDENVNALHARFGGAARQIGRGDLRGEGRALFGAFETDGASRSPTERVAFTVGDGDDGIVERALNEDLAASRSFLRTP